MDTPEPTVFRLEYKTDDSRLRKLADAYWASYRDPDGTIRFTHDVLSLAPVFGLRETQTAVTGPVMDSATAYYGRCARCQRERPYENRTEFTQRHRRFGRRRPCPQCHHELQMAREKEERAAAARRRRAIRREYRRNCFPIDVTRLTLKDAIYSLAVLRASRFSGSRRLGCRDSFHYLLSPGKCLDQEILTYLYNRGILAVDPNSPDADFAFDETGNPHRFYSTRVRWLLNDANPLNFAAGVERLLQRPAFPTAWRAELRALSELIARAECIDFIAMLMWENELRFEPPKDWQSVLSTGLSVLSPAQMLPLIFSAVKESYGGARNRRATWSELGEAFVQRLQALIDRARSETKAVQAWNRFKQCPRSMVSAVLYDTLLQASDDGFKKVPVTFCLPGPKPAPPPPERVSLNEPLIKQVIALSKLNEELGESELFSLSEPPSHLLDLLDRLSASDLAQLAAVMLVGRGDDDPEHFDKVVREWTRPFDWSLPEYLADKKMLWMFLESGLEVLSQEMVF